MVLDDRRREQFDQQLSTIGVTDVTYVTTATQCIHLLASEVFDLIFLDYDLTYLEIDKPSAENTGAVVARWLSNHKMNPNHKAHIIIHSVDPYGSQFMRDFLPEARVVPGAWLQDQFQDLMKRLQVDTP